MSLTLVPSQSLAQTLESLSLKVMANEHQALAELFEKNKKSFVDYLGELASREAEHRYQLKISRLLKNAKLPRNKLLKDFEVDRIPGLSASYVQSLISGEFIDRYENLLIFGNPGTGKTHLSIALAREWCVANRRVLYISAANLVQQLLIAKRSLSLEQYIKRLDAFEILVIDDISYIPFEASETDVLFTLLAARYEMRSVLITSNLPFANWNKIFKDEMTTAAAIDRLVHHAMILELNTESYRMANAKKRNSKPLLKKDK